MDDRILDDSFSANGVGFTPEIQKYLLTTAKWAKFLSIVSFVTIGFMVLVFIFAGSFLGSSPLGGGPEMLGAAPVLAIYAVILMIYIFPTLYLYRFSTNIKRGINSNDNELVTTSFLNLKKCFAFIGILTAIFVGLYLLMIIIGLLFGGLAALSI